MDCRIGRGWFQISYKIYYSRYKGIKLVGRLVRLAGNLVTNVKDE